MTTDCRPGWLCFDMSLRVTERAPNARHEFFSELPCFYQQQTHCNIVLWCNRSSSSASPVG
jgi:hypothetical protein